MMDDDRMYNIEARVLRLGQSISKVNIIIIH